MNDVNVSSKGQIKGQEHWTNKGDVKLFLWEKRAPGGPKNGTVLFVHGSSMASQPVFDLQVPGRPNSSAMDYFAERGFDTWCMDHEGYGRSDKNRGIDANIAEGADDLKAGSDYIFRTRNHTGPLLVYGISSGALRAALFAQRHPNRVRRLALDAHVWTGEGSPTLEQRRKKLPEYLKTKRRPIDKAFVRSIFERDHPGTADENVIEAFAKHILELDELDPERHLHRHVQQPAGGRSGPDQGAHHHHARRIRRHCGTRGPDQVFRGSAQPGQAVRHHAWDRARLAAAEELHDRAAHHAQLLHAARADLSDL